MIKACLISLQLHLQWFVEAFSRRGRKLAPLTPYRLFVLLLLFPLYLMVQAWHWLFLFVDEILFPGYHHIEVSKPLFIAGIPRSGTTFIHRTLAGDERQFSTFTTWQAILAPSICQRRLVRLFSRVDALCGNPAHNALASVTRRLTGKMEHIHAAGLRAPEEDYLALLPAAGCFIMMTAFPASESVWGPGRLETLPPARRQSLLQFYKACLQKHLHETGPGTRLLCKNAAFASWLCELHAMFPDARYLLCIRQPQLALSSQLSSLRPGLVFFATNTAANTIESTMENILSCWYQNVLEATQTTPKDRYGVVDQGELKNNTAALLTQNLNHLKIPITPKLAHCIQEAAHTSRCHSSRHKHTPLQSPQGDHSPVMDIYETIRQKQPV